ncbi:MAG: uroporphyrinogen decarboxylase/cobalamine-independent methonine synthase family protein, partial [Desulfocucumaceae bacterium]
PAVSVYGKSDYITVTREMIIGDLNEISDQIHSAGALVGVHSCDAIDWSILYQSSLDIVNLDAYNFGDSLIPFAWDLKDYIIRGGILALGMVPTSEKAFDETPESLTGRLENIWAQMTARGVPDQRLKQQTMITPSCGAGLLDPVLAARIYRLTRDLSARVRESFAK